MALNQPSGQNNEYPASRRNALWSATLYYAQGLPFSIVRQLAVVFFKDRGVSLQSLGFVSLYGIPWTFKFLWSPFIDTFSSKRRWVVAMEAILALLVGAVALAIPNGLSVQAVAAAFLVVAIVSATHDIATDGFYLEALGKTDQAKYSGWVVAAYRLAMLTGSGFLVSLSGRLGWGGAFGAAAVLLIALCVWHNFILPRPRSVGGIDQSTPLIPNQSLAHMAAGFKSFLELPGVWLAIAFVILFKLGDALLFGMSTPFLLDSGMSREQLGIISGVFGTVSAIGASMGGGWFISRYGLRRGLYAFGFIQNLAIPVYAFVAWSHGGRLWLLGGAVIVEQIAAGLGTAAYSNFLMRQNNPNYKATHYAVVTGMMSLTTMLGGVLSGFGAQKFGYAWFFTWAFVASLPGLVLIPFVARRPECKR